MFKTLIKTTRPLISKNGIRSMSTLIRTLIRTKDDEWYYRENDYYKMGLTKNIIEDILYIEIEEEKVFERGDIIGVVENVKAVGDIRAQFDCELLEINEEVIENLDILNNDLENTDTSWIIKIKPTVPDHEELLDTIRVTQEDVQRYNRLNKSSPWLNIYGREFLLG